MAEAWFGLLGVVIGGLLAAAASLVSESTRRKGADICGFAQELSSFTELGLSLGFEGVQIKFLSFPEDGEGILQIASELRSKATRFLAILLAVQ
jgi:hypothetical protein